MDELMGAREELAAIRERVEAATEGPWGHWPEAGEIEIITSVEPGGNEPRRDMEIIASSIRPRDGWDAIYGRDERHVYRNGEPDAEFIAHARTDVPRLVEALEAVVVALDEAGTQAAATYRSDGAHYNEGQLDAVELVETRVLAAIEAALTTDTKGEPR